MKKKFSSSSWHRIWNNTLFSLKIQSLSGDEYKFWGNFLCAASLSNGCVSINDLIFKTRLSEKNGKKMVKMLLDNQLAEEEDGFLFPHDWEDWQYDSDNSTQRVKKFREHKKEEMKRFMDVSETVNETFQEQPMERFRNSKETSPEQSRAETETETETETEKDSCPKSKTSGESLPKGFPEFWLAYPRKVQKQAAIKAWKKLNPPLEACLTALEWQKNLPDWLKDGGQFIPYPASWLNAGQWEDEKPTSSPIASQSHPYRASCMCGDCMRYEIDRDKRTQERNTPGGSR